METQEPKWSTNLHGVSKAKKENRKEGSSSVATSTITRLLQLADLTDTGVTGRADSLKGSKHTGDYFPRTPIPST